MNTAPPNHTHSATAALATFASSLRYTDIPPEVIDKAKLCLLDTVGCCAYATTLAPMQKLIRVVLAEGGRAVSTIIGRSERTAPTHAALVNGTAAHAFQLDEVHTGSTLHPGSVVVPTVLALSDAAGGLSGEDFLTAMIAGYEVGIRVGLAAKGEMFKRGWHNQGTTGPLAAAAAAARVLRLDPHQTLHAIGLAASQAAGLMAVQEGANAKGFHSGRAAQSGVYAALLAREGYTGVEHVLDVEYGGFFSTLVDAHDPAKLTAGLGTHWETLGVGFKSSPASNGSITAMHTLKRIMDSRGLQANDIERIRASVSTNTLEHCGWEFDAKTSKGVLAAQMNLRYGLAAMALDRAATPAQYAEARIAGADIAQFLPRIEVRAEPRYDRDPALRLACTLDVRTRSGETYADETLFRPGGAEDPMSVEALEEKFMTLATAVTTRERAELCLEHVRALENVRQVGLALA